MKLEGTYDVPVPRKKVWDAFLNPAQLKKAIPGCEKLEALGNDEFKATSRLTLTFGLRFDYQFPRTEMHNQYSTFDPNSPNPGAAGLPGALIFAGSGSGRAGNRTFEKPDADAWGPRLGFAYRLGDKTAIRGGYGIYYSGISFDQFIGQPTQGFQSNPTTVTTRVPTRR